MVIELKDGCVKSINQNEGYEIVTTNYTVTLETETRCLITPGLMVKVFVENMDTIKDMTERQFVYWIPAVVSTFVKPLEFSIYKNN